MDSQIRKNDFRLNVVISRIICCKDKENRLGKNHNLQYMLEYTCSFDSLSGAEGINQQMIIPVPERSRRAVTIQMNNPGSLEKLKD